MSYDMSTVTVKVDEDLKKKMASVKINWSEYIRESIHRRIELEERKSAAKELLEDLRVRKNVAPRGFINKALRELREGR